MNFSRLGPTKLTRVYFMHDSHHTTGPAQSVGKDVSCNQVFMLLLLLQLPATTISGDIALQDQPSASTKIVTGVHHCFVGPSQQVCHQNPTVTLSRTMLSTTWHSDPQ
eukprot:GHUV01048562.1.p2 GENE.GHUV01048562.1~~GHUV01048562.1.p2  ORF type:complete len:108 (-),score=8.03 GHUV01048562.1:626-949(-)